MGIFWHSLCMDLSLCSEVWAISVLVQWVCTAQCQISLATCCKPDNENQTRTWVSWKLIQANCCSSYSGPSSWLSPPMQSTFSRKASRKSLLTLTSGCLYPWHQLLDGSGKRQITIIFHIPMLYKNNNSDRVLRNLLLNANVTGLLSYQLSRIKTNLLAPCLQWYIIVLAILFFY